MSPGPSGSQSESHEDHAREDRQESDELDPHQALHREVGSGAGHLPGALDDLPAILGTRVIDSKPARLLTTIISPLVPCTARMAVVAFLAPEFFGKNALYVTWGLVLFSLASGATYFSTANGWYEIHPTAPAWTVYGTLNVNLQTTSARGATTFTVTVRDTTAPSITCSTNVTAEATGPNGAAVSYTVTATDTGFPGSPKNGRCDYTILFF